MKRKIIAGALLVVLLAAVAVWYFIDTKEKPAFNVNHKPLGNLDFQPVTLENFWGDTLHAEAYKLAVPENRNKPNSNHIEIAFGRLKSKSANPLPPFVITKRKT